MYHQNMFHFPSGSGTSFLNYCAANTPSRPRQWWRYELTRLSLNLDSHSRLYDLLSIFEKCSALSFLRLALPHHHSCVEWSCYGKKYGNFLIDCITRLRALRSFEVWRYRRIEGPIHKRASIAMGHHALHSNETDQSDIFWESQVHQILSRNTATSDVQEVLDGNKAKQPESTPQISQLADTLHYTLLD